MNFLYILPPIFLISNPEPASIPGNMFVKTPFLPYLLMRLRVLKYKIKKGKFG